MSVSSLYLVVYLYCEPLHHSHLWSAVCVVHVTVARKVSELGLVLTVVTLYVYVYSSLHLNFGCIFGYCLFTRNQKNTFFWFLTIWGTVDMQCCCCYSPHCT